jgi:hypothetical protein
MAGNERHCLSFALSAEEIILLAEKQGWSAGRNRNIERDISIHTTDGLLRQKMLKLKWA